MENSHFAPPSATHVQPLGRLLLFYDHVCFRSLLRPPLPPSILSLSLLPPCLWTGISALLETPGVRGREGGRWKNPSIPPADRRFSFSPLTFMLRSVARRSWWEVRQILRLPFEKRGTSWRRWEGLFVFLRSSSCNQFIWGGKESVELLVW